MTKGFRDRGGIWVLIQWCLMGGSLGLAPLTSGPDLGLFAKIVAILLIVSGSAFGIAGALTMGRVRTIYPEPAEHARLICHGIYALVRHPIYTSLILLSFGWSLAWNSVAGFLIAVVMTLFLMAKLSSEERRLGKRFSDYDAYMKKTKRLIPWIY
jgi:protein-S-isoprenylcysteine O-methyltransferase Ste14